jgi:hypothetical protein
MAIAAKAMKTIAQKISMPRDERCGRLGSSIIGKNTPVSDGATGEFAASAISPSRPTGYRPASGTRM